MGEASKIIRKFERFLGNNPGFEKQGSRIIYYVKESSEPLSIVSNKRPNYVITYDIESKTEKIHYFKSRGRLKNVG